MFYLALIGILILIIVFQRACTKPCQPITITKTDTVWLTYRDTIIDEHPVPVQVFKNGKPIIVTKIDTQFYVTKEPVDTATILEDYMATRIYKDSAANKYGTVWIQDTVTQNKIAGRRIWADIHIPQVTNTIPALTRNKIFAGLGVGSTGQTIGFGPRLFLLSKRDAMYGAGADVLPGQQPYYHINILWKIHL